jgi:flavodoxin
MEVKMSEILKKIRIDLKKAMLAEVGFRKQSSFSGNDFSAAISQKTVCRAIISMFPQIGKKPADSTDDDVIKLLKKYIGQEKERAIYELGYLKEKDVEGKNATEIKKLVFDTIRELGDALVVKTVMIAELYLPDQATEEEIIAWIEQNLDLDSFTNKMQAMRPIMQEFKGADGNFVKSILMKL